MNILYEIAHSIFSLKRDPSARSLSTVQMRQKAKVGKETPQDLHKEPL